MCGIIGYTGTQDAVPILVGGLASLEYRGYDSAGVALASDDGIKIVKSKGRIENLSKRLYDTGYHAPCGIGHTRWATHGEPSDKNAHPHSTENLSLVHNGIIENYDELQKRLKSLGYTFVSETDTEAAVKLIDLYYRESGDPVKAMFSAAAEIRGSFAFGVVFEKAPDTIYAMRKDSPLIVAMSECGGLIASDIPAILPYTNNYFRLEEEVLAVLTKDSVSFVNKNGESLTQPEETVSWSVGEAQKSGYPHFMLKEIFEEPEAIRKTVTPRLVNGLPDFSMLDKDIGRIHIVACGTAMHAGLVGKTMIERLARLPVNVEIASEFRYRDPILDKKDLVVLLSQSGETADTLAALRHSKACGVKTLAIVNVIGSSVAREADHVIYTMAGPEIAVASTKAYSVQCAIVSLLAIRLAFDCGKLDESEAKRLTALLINEVPAAVAAVLKKSEEIGKIAKNYTEGAEHLFYIGRGADSDLCTEASLKLKEISYIHSEAYAAGELKHGTISLVTEGVPVVALLTEHKLAEKMISGIREVKSRGAHTLAIATERIKDEFTVPCDDMIVVPKIDPLFEMFPAITVLQLFAYHASATRGLDVDKPRNLAKSVTVE